MRTFDKHSLTVVQVRMPEFKVQSNDGKLVADKGMSDDVLSGSSRGFIRSVKPVRAKSDTDTSTR